MVVRHMKGWRPVEAAQAFKWRQRASQRELPAADNGLGQGGRVCRGTLYVLPCPWRARAWSGRLAVGEEWTGCYSGHMRVWLSAQPVGGRPADGAAGQAGRGWSYRVWAGRGSPSFVSLMMCISAARDVVVGRLHEGYVRTCLRRYSLRRRLELRSN